MDNFSRDPLGGHAMLQTAENVAAKHQITTAQQHDVVLMREQQYRDALADGCAFQKRYMSLPFEVPHPRSEKQPRRSNAMTASVSPRPTALPISSRSNPAEP